MFTSSIVASSRSQTMAIAQDVTKPAQPDPIADAIKAMVGDAKCPIVFSGFSGTGYDDTSAEKRDSAIRETLTEAIDLYGADNVFVCCGGTQDGGICDAAYRIAKELGLRTGGIVAEQGAEYRSDECDTLVAVPTSGPNDWNVKSRVDGSSYMLHPIYEQGVLVVLGGGEVARNELDEALSKGVAAIVYPTLAPKRPKPGQPAQPVADFMLRKCGELSDAPVLFPRHDGTA